MLESYLWVQEQVERVRTVKQARFDDDLYDIQWHLHNVSTPAVNVNAEGAWDMGYTGAGVTIAIVDDGLDFNHPDLAANFDAVSSWNVNFNTNDVGPINGNDHGTAAGGLAAAAPDGTCGVGVAYNAKLAGIVLLQKDKLTDAEEAQALQFSSDTIDIYSNSWGPLEQTVDGPGYITKNVIKTLSEVGRKGKGSIYVWVSGNGGPSDNCNNDGYANSRYTIAVGSVSYDGTQTPYGEECSSMFAVTPSGTGDIFGSMDIATTGLLDSSDEPTCTRTFSGSTCFFYFSYPRFSLMSYR